MADKDIDLVPRSGVDTLADRRRLGRVDYENPHLLRLLRVPGDAPLPDEPAEEPVIPEADGDSLAPARGILLGMLIGSGMWIAGGLITWLVL